MPGALLMPGDDRPAGVPPAWIDRLATTVRRIVIASAREHLERGARGGAPCDGRLR